jgi:hypothetical protein
VSFHCWPTTGEESLVGGDAGRYLCHTEVDGELSTLWAAVSSTVELVLGRSPDETFQVEVMDELVAEFQRLEELYSQLEWPATRIYVLLLGPPLGQARWAECLDEATGHLGAELTA